MGDRALIIFTDGTELSPTCYLHWGGSDVRSLLEALATVMVGRDGDVSYSCARFLAIACNATPGNLSVGCFNGPDTAEEVKGMSHGDAGAFLVNCKTWVAECFGGYGFTLPDGKTTAAKWDLRNLCVPSEAEAS